jgi:hypothetical protein
MGLNTKAPGPYIVRSKEIFVLPIARLMHAQGPWSEISRLSSFPQLLSLQHKYICNNDAFTMIGWQLSIPHVRIR